jgi:membrane protein DedA with SNARE-associated domain
MLTVIITKGARFLFHGLSGQLRQFLVAHSGPILFGVVFVDQIGLPLPSEPWLLAAGAMFAKGQINAELVMGVSVMACLVADSLWFCAGRLFAGHIWRLFSPLKGAPRSWFCQTESLLIRHSLRGLIAAKFIPGAGMALPAVAGALGASVGKFLLYDGLGSILYGSLYFMAGFLFHNQLQGLVAALNGMGFVVMALVLVLGLAYVAYMCLRGLLASPGDRVSTPPNARKSDDE